LLLQLFSLVADSFYPDDDDSFLETSVLAKATWRKIPEDGILHIRLRENIKSCTALTGWAL
jgi:hypothetical protein